MRKCFKILPIVFLLNTTLYANVTDLYFQRLREKSYAFKFDNTSTIKEKSYAQFIDHNNRELGTFAQRYWVDESNATSDNAPVFLFLCGEGSCGPDQLRGYVSDLAQKYHARMIALEHRYYGKSLPTKTFSTNDLQYLTYHNVMQDIVRFEKDMIHDNHYTGKWIAFGGSYAGTLSAFYREKFPDMVAGSVASSAPVMVKDTFDGFDTKTTEVVGPACANKIRTVIKEVEAALPNKENMDAIKAKFDASDIVNNMDFLGLLGDIAEGAVQYGYQEPFCKFLKAYSKPIDGYAEFAKYAFAAFGVNPVQLTMQGAMSEDPKDYEGFVGLRQWSYQVCKDFGTYGISNPDPEKSTRSRLLDQVDEDGCKRLFGVEMKPNTAYLNNTYYLPLFNESVSNIYFTNGSNDPWSLLSIADENNNTTNKNLSHFMIKAGSHCTDIGPVDEENDSDSLKQARVKMDSLIGEWLAK